MSAVQVQKVTWSKEVMIDYMLANPGVTQNDLARVFDRTPTWISIIMNSDVFRAAFEERRKEMADPIIIATLKDKINTAAHLSMETIIERLSQPALKPTDAFVLEAAKLATTAMGFGARNAGDNDKPAVQFIVNLPGKMQTNEWANRYSPDVPMIQEVPRDSNP